MAKGNVLVTATGGRSVGAGLLHSLVRSSAEVAARWNVVAADADPFSWGLYQVPHAELLPLAHSPDYLGAVQKVIRKHGIDAIVPGSEPEVAVLTAFRDQLCVPVIANSEDLVPLMTDKFRAAQRLQELGLPGIPTFRLEEWKTAVSKYPYPFVIKPTRGTGGSKGVVLCVNEQQIREVVAATAPGSGYCIQHLVGNGEEEYTVGVLSDKEGNLIDTIVMRRKLIGLSLLDCKELQGRRHAISTGYSQGYFVRNEVVQSFCEKLARDLGSVGPLNVQLRMDGDTPYVFEIHPRFSGTSPMRADVGFNEVDLLLRNHLFDERFGRQSFRTDVAVIRAFETTIVPTDRLLSGRRAE